MHLIPVGSRQAKQKHKFMNQKEFLETILDDAEKSLIQKFVDNEKMREAVRKVLLFGAYGNGTIQKGKKATPFYNFALTLALEGKSTNEQLGADLRACTEGIKIVENAFNAMSIFKSIEEEKPKGNPAR